MAVDIKKLFDEDPNTPEAMAMRAEEQQREILWENNGQALQEWAEGAVKGMQELNRAATQRDIIDNKYVGDENPYEDDYVAPKMSQEQLEASEWYDKAMNNYLSETVKPAAVAGSMLLGPVGGTLAKAATSAMTIPLILDMSAENIAKHGLWEGTKETAKGMVLPMATYDAFTSEDPDMKAYRQRYPLRSLLSNVAMDAVALHPVAVGAKNLATRMRYEHLKQKYKNKTEAEISAMVDKEITDASKTPDELLKETVEPKNTETTAKTEEPTTPQEVAKANPEMTIEDVEIKHQESAPPKYNSGDKVIDALDRIIDKKEQKGIIREDTYDRVADYLSEKQIGQLLNGNVHPVVKDIMKRFGLDETKAAKVLKQIYAGEDSVSTKSDVSADRMFNESEPTEPIQAMRKPRNNLEEMNDAARPEVNEALDNIAQDQIYQDKITERTDNIAKEAYKQPYRGAKGEVKPSESNIKDRVGWNDVEHTANQITHTFHSTVEMVQDALGYFNTRSKEIVHQGHQAAGTIAHEISHKVADQLRLEPLQRSVIRLADSIYKETGVLEPSERRVIGFFETYADNPEGARQLFPEYFRAVEEAAMRNPEIRQQLEGLARQSLIDNELRNACVSIFGEGTYSRAEHWGEGFAEFLHEYLYNPESAREHYPNTAPHFESLIDAHPELKGNLDLLGNQIRKVLSQHGFEAGRAAQETPGDVAARQKKGILTKIADVGDAYVKTMLDEYVDVRDKVETYAKDHGFTIPSYADPVKVMEAIKSTTPARIAMILGNTNISTENAIKAIRQVCGGIKLENVVFKDVMDSLKQAYKSGEITEDFLKLCGTKDGKLATVYEAFMVFVNALNNYDIIKVKNAERVAEHQGTLARNARRREGILRDYDRRMSNIDRQIGRELSKLFSVSPTKYTQAIGKIRELLVKERDRLTKEFANDAPRLKDITEKFDKKLAEIDGDIAEAMGRMARMSEEEINKKHYGSSILDKQKRKRAERNEVKADKDVAVMQEEAKQKDINAKKGKDIAKAIEDIEDKVESVMSSLYEDAIKHHTKDIDMAVSKLERELTRLQEALANDRRLTDLDASDTAAQGAIDLINAGLDDYVTNIKHRNELGNDDIREILRTAPKAFYRTARLMSKYNNNLLELGVYYGFFTRRTVEKFKKERPHYSPLERSFSEENPDFVGIHNFMESLSETGTDRVVKDPLMALQNRTAALITRGEKNRVKKAWAKLATREDGGGLVAFVPEVNPADRHARGIFSVYENGREVFYKAGDAVIYDAINNMDSFSSALTQNIVTQAGKYLARVQRIGATQTPAFMIWNIMRDTLTASLNHRSKGMVVPLLDTFQGYWYLSNKKYEEQYAQFYAQGVPFATRRLSDAEVTKGWMKYIQEGKADTVLQKGWNLAERGWDAYTNVGDKIEQAPRFMEFKRLLEEGASIFEAGEAARDITVNFQKGGTVSRGINQYVPFFNATMQGTHTMYKAFQRDPKAFMTRAMTLITVPTLTLWAMNHNEEWYRDLPAYEKDRHWFLKVGGTIYKYPKPELAGYLFGTLPETILNYMNDADPRAFKDTMFHSLVQDSILPTGLPTAVTIITQWQANYDYFRERNIVPAHLLKKPEEEQYDRNTSKTAIKLGELTGQSPMKIDNAFRTALSSMANTAIGIEGMFLNETKDPRRTMFDNMRFFRNPRARTRTSDVFQKTYNELEKKVNSNHYVKGKDKTLDQRWAEMKTANKEIKKKWKEYNSILDSKLDDKTKSAELDKIQQEIESKKRKTIRTNGYKYIQNPGY